MTSLVFLHGLGGGHHAWDAQLPCFAARGYGAHAWDQPGYGHSAIVEPYDLEQISLALKRLVESLDDGQVVLVGHSMGGFVAQETYARFPEIVKGLVLGFTSAAFGGGDAEFVRKFVAARIEPLDAGKTMQEIAAQLVPAMRGTRSDSAGLASAERIMGGIPPATYRKAVQLLTTFDRKSDLEKIRVPALLIAGAEDRTAPAPAMERMARKIAGSEFKILEGCGHLGPMDRPQEFNAALLAFLQKHKL